MANNAPEWEGSVKTKNFFEKMGFGLYPPGYDRRVHGPYMPDRYYGPKDKPFGEVKLSELPQWIGRRDKSPFAIAQAFSRAEFRYVAKFVEPARAKAGTYFWTALFLTSWVFYVNHWSHVKHHRNQKYHW